MADDANTNVDASQVDADASQAQVADTSASQVDAGTDTAVDPGEHARLRKELAAVRREAAASRTKLKDYEDASLNDQQKLEQAKSSAEARADQLETRVRDLQAQVAASKLGVRADAVGDVVKLIDWDQIDDPSDPKQVERAVRETLKERPYLSGRPGGLDAGIGQTGRVSGKPSLGALMRREAGIHQ